MGRANKNILTSVWQPDQIQMHQNDLILDRFLEKIQYL